MIAGGGGWAPVAGDMLGGILQLEGEETDEAGLKREDEEGQSSEATG
jgi:hypothetical protein